MADSNVCALPKTKDETIEGGGQEAGSKGPSGLETYLRMPEQMPTEGKK